MNQVIHGDCLEVMPTLPDKSIDMILCDLPYGTTACKWDTIIPFEPLWEQYKRIIKDNGAIVLFGSEPFSSYLRMSSIKIYKYDWIWYKNNPTGIGLVGKQPMRSYENVMVFNCVGMFYPQKMKSRITDRGLGGYNGRFSSKKSDHYGFQPKKHAPNRLYEFVNPWNVLEFNVEPRSKGYLHPTQKPVALFEYLIKTYTNEGETVLDNCAGSGTTAIACINTNRNYILIEKEKGYIDIINNRVAEHEQQLALC